MLSVAENRPRGNPRLHQARGQRDLPRHLPQGSVAQHYHGVAIAEGEIEGQHREVQHLLRGRGGEDEGVGVAVAEPAAGELDVGLLGRDVAEAGPASHHVHEHARHLGPDHVGEALEHEAEAGRGGEGETASARAPTSVHQVHGGHFAHGLKKEAAEPGQQLRHELGAFGRGRDGVAEKMTASGEERAEG